MAKFLFEKSNNGFWEWVEKTMRLYNYKGGWHEVNENCDDWLEGYMIQAEDWHDLYLKTGFCSLETDAYEREVWLAPNGKFYEGDGHSLCANWLVDILYGIQDFDFGESYLIQRGWLKLSRWMHDLYLYDGLFNEMTQAQLDSLYDWCRIHNKEFPKNIFVREVEII